MADPVDPDRLPYGGTWNGVADLVDVDPEDYTKHGSTLATSSSATDINNAITAANSAGGGKYVELASGTFNLAGNINMKSNVSLRGQVDANGLPATIINFDQDIRYVEMDFGGWDADNASAFTTRQISSGHTRGSTSITLTAAPTGLTAGRIVVIVAPANNPTIDGEGGFTDWLPSTTSYPFTYVVRVTAVSGSTFDFFPPLDPDYISGLTCHIYYRAAADQIDFAGLENLQFQVAGRTDFFDGQIVNIGGANQCWFDNCIFYDVGVVTSLNAAIWFYISYNCRVKRCHFSGCSDPGNSGLYAMSSLHTSGLAVYANEFDNNSNIWPILTTSRSVFVDNYCHDMDYGTFQSQWVFFHGSHSCYNLVEGNYIKGEIFNDLTDAGNHSHSRNTLYFRNRIVGQDTGTTTNLNCIVCQDHHDNVTCAGNVFGNGAQDAVTGGNGGTTGEGIGYIYNMDTESTATVEKFANYNTVTGGIPVAEQLGGGDALVNSYFHDSKPSYYGDRPYPVVDPTNFSQSDDVENFPAGYRSVNGEDPPEEGGGGGSVGFTSATFTSLTVRVA